VQRGTVLVLVVGALTLAPLPTASADVSSATGTTVSTAAAEPFNGRVASFSSSSGRGYPYLLVRLDATKQLTEYGERNNAIYIRLPKRPRR
jgi:hypothetical protein